MPFTNENLLTALGVVNIFETSRTFGDYDACVVLNDGAGVSYGISQFTHRSGSLAAVVKKYLAAGQIEREALSSALPTLNKTSKAAIAKLASDQTFKNALRRAAASAEMKDAQNAIAFEMYLRPALEICATRDFTCPLSLAVVYDSITHGSWERIAARVTRARANSAVPEDPRVAEKAWITDYIRARHAWLMRTPRLKATTYRTKFFLDQIGSGNWDLRLPLKVHGVLLSREMLPARQIAMIDGSALEPKQSSLPSPGRALDAAAAGFDRLDGMVSGVIARSDRAKSLWTTIGGTLWQAAWAVFGFFAGLPREVWIVVAIIAGALMLLFLYRQITLGRIRESRLNSDKADWAETTG